MLWSLAVPVAGGAVCVEPAHAAAAQQAAVKTFTSTDSKFEFDYPDTWAIAVVRHRA